MKIDLNNKIIWVIGASSGIGHALVHELQKFNSKIIISARNTEKLNTLAASSDDTIPLPMDLSDNSEVILKISEAVSLFSHIDIVFFCAGQSQRTFAENTPQSNTRRIMEVNFFSAVTIARELIPVMKARNCGRFVIISSLMGRFGAKQRSSYSASKHALHGYFESVRAEEWNNGIRVTIAILGYINTEFSKNALTENGEIYNKIDNGQKNGMPAKDCALQIIRGVEDDKEELLIGGIEKYATFLKRFMPTLLSKILRNKNIN